MAQHKFSIGARTETGYVRKENQDRMGWSETPFGDVWLVADGVGGLKDGGEAAQMVIDGFTQRLQSAAPGESFAEAARAALAETNSAVYARGKTDDSETSKMGSTVVLARIFGDRLQVAHVGDSRAYLFRGNKLRRLTSDHSRAQEMVKRGILSEEEARHHPESSRLTRAIGQREGIDLDLSEPIPLQQGDLILLCSDGLCGYVPDEEIATALAESAEPKTVANLLVQQALDEGGEDNITVQAVRYGRPARKLLVTLRLPKDRKKLLVPAGAALLAVLICALAFLPAGRSLVSALFSAAIPAGGQDASELKSENIQAMESEQLERKDAEIARLEEDLAQARQQLEQNGVQLASVRSEIDGLRRQRSELAENAANAQTIEQELESKSQQLDEANSKLEQAASQTADLQKEIAELKAALKRTKAELEQLQADAAARAAKRTAEGDSDSASSDSDEAADPGGQQQDPQTEGAPTEGSTDEETPPEVRP